MRRVLLAAAAAFVIGGIATGAVLTQAQPAPPPEQTDGAPPPHHPGMMGWGHPPQHGDAGPGWQHEGWMHRRGMMMQQFGLIYPQKDRNLSPADVQKIAEAFLLFRGNHTWKVTDVAPVADGPIGFSLTTPEGSVVAKFTMDPHTGRVRRVG